MAKRSDIKFEIEGLEEVKKMLRTLPQQVNDKIIYDINRQAANIVKKELEDSAPDSNTSKKSKNKIANSIVIAKQRGSKSGVNIGFKKRVWYVTLMERGTKVRTLKGKGKYKKGTNRGKITRKPFVSQAHQRAFPKAVQYFTDNFLKIVNRSIKKQLRRVNKARR